MNHDWMLVRVTSVVVVAPFTLDLTFSDGTRKIVNLESDLWGEVFAPVTDSTYFARVALDPEGGTIVWPNGADLAPEFLYTHAEAGEVARDRNE